MSTLVHAAMPRLPVFLKCWMRHGDIGICSSVVLGSTWAKAERSPDTSTSRRTTLAWVGKESLYVGKESLYIGKESPVCRPETTVCRQEVPGCVKQAWSSHTHMPKTDQAAQCNLNRKTKKSCKHQKDTDLKLKEAEEDDACCILTCAKLADCHCTLSTHTRRTACWT